MLQREPPPALRPFISTLWADEPAAGGPVLRERVLPTGHMHLVFRSSAHPLRILDDPCGRRGSTLGHAVVGGARAEAYLREVLPGGATVGAELRAGACRALLGVPANLLADRHVPLEDLWGAEAMHACDRIFSARGAAARLDALAEILAGRLPRVHGLHPAVAAALARFRESQDVHAAVAASGYSHRHFIALFERETGLTPKRLCRVQRFRKLLAHAASHPMLPWTELALAHGYSDQAHFNREFRAFAGITPGEYRRAAPRYPHHVPLA
ncbi:MAG TPA: helix-turn-helix domain-containing protein [Rhodanobacteraceae bacterium]|jgi:AraC-like DNA-binding protein|nr:helix-turn-helix domain-containing protein [Rhodanobacteraceae bacterium]